MRRGAVARRRIGQRRAAGLQVHNPWPAGAQGARTVARRPPLSSFREPSHEQQAALQDLFRTLLHELMTAKTRVHELQLEMTN